MVACIRRRRKAQYGGKSSGMVEVGFGVWEGYNPRSAPPNRTRGSQPLLTPRKHREKKKYVSHLSSPAVSTAAVIIVAALVETSLQACDGSGLTAAACHAIPAAAVEKA